MDKYLAYSELMNGAGTERVTFATLKLAREYATSMVGPDGDAERVYVEHVEEGIADNFDAREAVEIGCWTVAKLERGDLTFEKIQKLGYSAELHYTGRHECKVNVGPRGGVQERITRVRVSGSLKTWKRPQLPKFRLPVKYGLYESSAIEPHNVGDFHLASECPALALYAQFVADQLRDAQAS